MQAGLFSAPAPRVFEIAAFRPFLEDLAAGLLALAGEDPLALARATVLLPTRRAGRALAAALLRLSGNRSAILPRIHPLGELADEPLLLSGALDFPPPISPLARVALLSRLVAKADPGLPFDRTWRLAVELGSLLDELALAEVEPGRLATLVPEEHAAHWQKTMRFLEILTGAWPQVLRERGLSDPAERRVRALRAQVAAWERAPPAGPVIAAGPASAFPALADLLAAVSRLPQGAVVLPAIDRTLPAGLWQALPETHPQAGLAALLARLGVARESVLPWPARASTADRPDRAGLLAAVFAPPAGLAAWRVRDPERWRPALSGLARLEAAETHEEAAVVALALRRALEIPGRSVAVVTPDRQLARRIADACARHGIAVDDTGGEPAKNAPAGVFLRLLARAVAEQLAPTPLLALLKHPFAAAGHDPAHFRAAARALEVAVLRGPRPAPALEGLAAALERAGGPDAEAGRGALERLSPILAPLLALAARPEAPLPELLEAHLAAAEALAARPDRPGPLVLWQGEAGETLARHLADLAEAVADLPPVAPSRFPDLFEAMLEGPVVRLVRTEDPHPRVQILGTLEARLQAFDTLILAGLNEGTWPAAEAPGPWLSRPMRRA
ncbi:MAG: double-strand break repair protein AddB, partial [Elioraea sp.]|nr:double-strand break repair protein AddB [Elioraea sp.]